MEQHSLSDSKEKGSTIFTILLVEDNFLTRRMIKKVLEKNYIVKEAGDTQKAELMLRSGNIHLVILDIHLGNEKKDGIWLAAQINKIYSIPFIYLTAFANNDISQLAIAAQPAAYISKPFKEVDLVLSIEIALRKYVSTRPAANTWIIVKEGDYYMKLSISAIDYFESIGNYLQVFSNGKVYKCRSTIKEMLGLLMEDVFIQTHRAFIVNRNKIVKYNSGNVIVGESIIPVSSKYANAISL